MGDNYYYCSSELREDGKVQSRGARLHCQGKTRSIHKGATHSEAMQ